MKNYQKNSIYPSVLVSCMTNQPKPALYMKTHKGHLKCLSLELHLNPWFKWAPLNLLLFALAQTTSHIHAMIIHHIVAFALIVFFSVAGACPLSVGVFRRWVWWHRWRAILSSEVPGKQNPPLFIPIQPYSLALS